MGNKFEGLLSKVKINGSKDDVDYHLQYTLQDEYCKYTSLNVNYLDLMNDELKYNYMIDIAICIKMLNNNNPENISISLIDECEFDKCIDITLDCPNCLNSASWVRFDLHSMGKCNNCRNNKNYNGQIIKTESLIQKNIYNSIYLFVCSIAMEHHSFSEVLEDSIISTQPIPKFDAKCNVRFRVKCEKCNKCSLGNVIDIDINHRYSSRLQPKMFLPECNHMKSVKIKHIDTWMKYREIMTSEKLTKLLMQILQNDVPISIIQLLVSFAV